ncbi:ribonuclease III [Algiphilus aromaticivorans]|uniref:ribonuclease III n=1 Tax=Algiphilus aromaticivorans TaxID=382454 RepID=UPI0005C1D316|nr:ribonuclease III [Algiphilus aromaticivorans]
MNREHLYRLLGYRFRDAALLERAMTHRSAGSGHYERLEFLGDSLLNFVVAQALYQRLPEATEGDLTRMRAALVREETLGAVAADLGLADFVQLGGSALKSGVYRRRSVLADTVEALIGAVLLDADIDTARECVERWWGERLITLPDPDTLKDPKTRLQEWLQGRSRPRPEYEVLEISGPAHQQRFRVCCRLDDGNEHVEGNGASRRGAEQNAARAMLEKLDA